MYLSTNAKITCIFSDGSTLKYTVKKLSLIPEYANRHTATAKSITVQEYPFKDNKPIDWLKGRR